MSAPPPDTPAARLRAAIDPRKHRDPGPLLREDRGRSSLVSA